MTGASSGSGMRTPHAELLLDTARAAAGLGIRSAAVAPRQLVFRHGPYEVDVLLQTASADSAVVWGQVMSQHGSPCDGATVAFVAAAGDELASTATDAFGEFRLLVSAGRDGALRISAGDARFLCWLPVTPPGGIA